MRFKKLWVFSLLFACSFRYTYLLDILADLASLTRAARQFGMQLCINDCMVSTHKASLKGSAYAFRAGNSVKTENAFLWKNGANSFCL